MNSKKVLLSFSSGIIFPLLILSLVSCNLLSSDDDNSSKKDEPVYVPIKILEDNSIFCMPNYTDCQETENSLSCIELVIDNDNDFNKYFTCSEQVKINYNEDFVLAGISTLQPNCIYVKDQTVQLSLDTIRYKVTIGDMDCAMPQRAKYIILISKKYVGYPVKFIIIKET
ncbi:MAG: hypothetical protein R6W90_06545 [Ignavibacteriaceae bacterium]